MKMATKKNKIKDLEKLSPEDRIRKLREIEEEDRKEIEAAQSLIKESEDQIVIEERVKRVKPPETGEVDIDDLFKPEEESLEDTVEAEKPRISEEDLRQQQQYIHELPTQQIEQRAGYIQQRIQETGYVTNELRAEIGSIYQEIRQREEDIRNGAYHSSSKNIEHQLSVAKRIAGETLSDLYKR